MPLTASTSMGKSWWTAHSLKGVRPFTLPSKRSQESFSMQLLRYDSQKSLVFSWANVKLQSDSGFSSLLLCFNG